MQVEVIASGSKANCTLLKCGSTNILIDVGPSSNLVITELAKKDLDPNDINAIIITHTHSDHIKGLKVFIKNTKAKVYINEELVSDLIKIVPAQQIVLVDNQFLISDIKVELLKMSHDVPCYGLILSYNQKDLVYITDTGYVNKRYLPRITNKNFYILETNYNEKMLMEGPYPYQLKQRILSDNGHLSNRYAGSLLAKCIGPKTEYIFLAHISEHNNTKDLVLEEVCDELKETNFDFNRLILTDQNTPSEMIEI